MSDEKMPERVWVGHHDYGGVRGSYDLSRLPPDAADRKASTEYVRAELHDALKAECERLRNGLVEFGQHDWSCDLKLRPGCSRDVAGDDPRCDCGLRAALTPPTKKEGGTT